MSDGTQYNNLQELRDSITALVYTNNNNEVSADDEQTAMLNIVETLGNMVSESMDHQNITNKDIDGHPIQAIDGDGLLSINSIENTDTFAVRRVSEIDWYGITIEELLGHISTEPLTLTNKTIDASENNIIITTDDITEGANKFISSNDKSNLKTLTNGSNADSLHRHAGQILEYIETVDQLQTFLTTAGTKQGIVIKPLTITTSLYVTGTKYLYGEDIIIEDLPDIGVTNTINLYISNNVVLGADNVDTVVYNPNMSANIHFNTIKPIGNTAKSFTLAPTSSGSFNATYAFAPAIVNLTNITKNILTFKPLPVVYTETGSEYIYTITYAINNEVTMELSYLANPSLPIEFNMLPQTTNNVLLVFELFEDVITQVNSPGSASWNLSKFYNNTTDITVGLMGTTVGDYQRLVWNPGPGSIYYGSSSTSSINLSEEELVFTATPVSGDFTRKLTLKGRLSKTELY